MNRPNIDSREARAATLRQRKPKMDTLESRAMGMVRQRESMPSGDRDLEMEGWLADCVGLLIRRKIHIADLRKSRDAFAVLLMLSLTINAIVAIMVLP